MQPTFILDTNIEFSTTYVLRGSGLDTASFNANFDLNSEIISNALITLVENTFIDTPMPSAMHPFQVRIEAVTDYPSANSRSYLLTWARRILKDMGVLAAPIGIQVKLIIRVTHRRFGFNNGDEAFTKLKAKLISWQSGTFSQFTIQLRYLLLPLPQINKYFHIYL